MNAVDILLLVVIGVVVFFAVKSMRKKKGSCSCGCQDCDKACAEKK